MSSLLWIDPTEFMCEVQKNKKKNSELTNEMMKTRIYLYVNPQITYQVPEIRTFMSSKSKTD